MKYQHRWGNTLDLFKPLILEHHEIAIVEETGELVFAASNRVTQYVKIDWDNILNRPNADADRLYVDTHLASFPINPAGRENNSILVFDQATSTYLNKTLASIQGTIISDIDLLKTNVMSNTADIETLRLSKVNIAVTNGLEANKADITWVTTQLAGKENANYLAAKLIDTDGRTDQTLLIYNEGLNKYMHTTVAILQGGVALEVDVLQEQMSTLLTTTIPSFDTIVSVDSKIASLPTSTYVNAQIAAAIAPFATKTEVTTGLNGKADSSALTSLSSSLTTSINDRALTTYVDSHLSGKTVNNSARVDQSVVTYDQTTDAYIHIPVSTLIAAATLPTPSRWNYVSAPQSIAIGQSLDLEITIPAIRMYGVGLSIAGLASDHTLTATLYGYQNKTDGQYSSNFSYTLLNDNSQAWIYRNKEGELKMHLRLINTCEKNLSNITVSIVMEPF